jgi:hypothetical protein
VGGGPDAEPPEKPRFGRVTHIEGGGDLVFGDSGVLRAWLASALPVSEVAPDPDAVPPVEWPANVPKPFTERGELTRHREEWAPRWAVCAYCLVAHGEKHRAGCPGGRI